MQTAPTENPLQMIYLLHEASQQKKLTKEGI